VTGTKILIATMSLDMGGAETYILELCKALTKKGMKVYVASNGGAYVPELTARGAVHYKVPLHNKKPHNMLRSYRELKRIITEHDIRLVHAHARIPAFICGFLRRQMGFRFVTTAHWVFTTKFPYNLLSNWGEKSLAVSEDIKEYNVLHYGMEPDDVFVTVNGMDTEKFSPDAEPVPCDDGASLRIMTLSRLDRDRSLQGHLLIEAAPVLVEREPNLAIYIIGDGNDFENIKAKAEAMNARLGREVIKLPGKQVEVHRWLAIADIFVNVSRSVLEAMSAAKPVVISGNEGYIGLFDKKNEDSLRAAVSTNFCCRGCGEATLGKLTADLMTLLNMSAEERAEMGRFNREFILENYSSERVAEDSMALYRAVLASAPPKPVRRADVIISGYYGYNNSGDDMILESILSDLKARKVDISITVLSKRPRETQEQFGVNAVYRFNFIAIWLLLRRTRLLLTGGGSVVQDGTSTRSLIYYLGIIRTAMRYGVKNVLYANGIGPIRKPANIERMRKVLNKVELITLREEASFKVLEEHGVNAPKIIVTADPVFNLPAPDFARARTQLTVLGIEPRRFFCIALRQWRHNPQGFEQEIAQVADYIAEKHELTALFVPMWLEQDTEISRKVMAYMKSPAIFLENAEDVRGIVGLSAFTLAMRLHTLIYAINEAVPVVGLVYDPKVQALMESVGQEFYLAVEEARAERLIGFVDGIFADYAGISERLGEARDEARGLAAENAELAVGYLR